VNAHTSSNANTLPPLAPHPWLQLQQEQRALKLEVGELKALARECADESRRYAAQLAEARAQASARGRGGTGRGAG
jgi:hypothetical protein